MAASVLGKRSRRALAREESELASPSKKRHTRRTAPHIHEDAPQPEDHDTVLPTVPEAAPKLKRTCHIPTPRHAQKDSNDIEEDTKENPPPTLAAPSYGRSKDVSAAVTPSAPRHRVQLAGKLRTPLSNRRSGTPRTQSAYSTARQLFTQSASPSRVIGRDAERRQLQTFIETAVASKTGGCTYVSGPPGTGKSALVQELLSTLVDVDGIKCSTVNCVSFRTSSQVLGKLAEDLSLPAFCDARNGANSFAKAFTSKIKKLMHLVLLDEIDSLLDSDCDFLYSIFEWSMHPSSSLILIGIANALDLTDRFLPRLKARNLQPRLMPFMPYTAKEMSSIITGKLRSLLPHGSTVAADFVPFLHPAAIQLIGKKIASQTGDLRKAFNLARRTIDQIELEVSSKASSDSPSPTKQPLSEVSNLCSQLPPSPPSSSPLKPSTPSSTQMSYQSFTVETAPRATIAHVAQMASSIFNNSATSRLHGLNLQQKAVLCSLVANERRRADRDPYKTPSKSASRILTIRDLFEKYSRLCQRDEGLLHPLKNTEFRDVIASLETLGLLHESTSRTSSSLTPSKTPSRVGRNPDERQVVSTVSESEVRETLQGPGGDLLSRLLDD